MKKYTLIILALFSAFFTFSQTVTLTGNVQTDVDGDQSGIKIKYSLQKTSGFTYTTTVDSVTTDIDGNYSISYDLNTNTTGFGNAYSPALINIDMSKPGFDSEKIENYSTTEPGAFTIDRKLLFTTGTTIYTPSICMVRVDTATNFNNIVWEREDNLDIQNYIVYKLVDNVWEQYDDLGFTDLSICEDFNTNLNGAEFYQIQAIFTNGKKSAYSSALKAPHVEVSMLNGAPQIEWMNGNDLTKIDPTTVAGIKIYRGTDKQNMEVIKEYTLAEILAQASLNYVITDLDIDLGGKFYYQVGYEMISQCAPKDLKVESGPFSLAMSNIAESETIPAKTTGVSKAEQKNIRVYSQSNGIKIIANTHTKYSVCNVQGVIVKEGVCVGEDNIPLNSGTYIISTTYGSNTVIVK